MTRSGTLDDIVPAISRTLRAVDDRAPIVYLRTMDEQLESLTWPIQALATLLASFATGSLLIATIGQYAAMAFTMRRWIRDFGVRMALGASSREILRSEVFEGLRMTAIGLAIGGALSLATAIALRSMLFGVTPTDTSTYVGVFALLAAASLVACVLPAHRAARIDPMQALREE
jgi:putative ABC transport system permease protein